MIGPKKILRLRDWFGHLSYAWKATERDLIASGLNTRSAKTLIENRNKINLHNELEKIAKADAWIVTLSDNDYPPLLKELDEAPAVLYVRGTLQAQDNLAISVVGTRKATKYGRDVAFDLSQKLASQNITIISGLAQGIDGTAHKGALAGKGRTLAILGCGVDTIYPRQNTDLANAIINQGALISEFPIGTQPIGTNFPRRNRILSGMALGVLVVEAPEGSGALITASLAAEQGREVFAVPANIYNPMGHGTNRLIQDGAKLVTNISDILDELNLAYERVETRVKTVEIIPANDLEQKLLDILGVDPIHIDELVRLSDLPIAEVSSTLTILELKGLVNSLNNMHYQKSQLV